MIPPYCHSSSDGGFGELIEMVPRWWLEVTNNIEMSGKECPHSQSAAQPSVTT